MKHNYNDKFDIKGIDLNIEIMGVFPGGQQRTIQIKENSYKILMNGIEVDITESNLDILKNAVKKEEVKPITKKAVK